MFEKAIVLALVFPGFLLGVGPIAFINAAEQATIIDPTTTGAVVAAFIGALGSYTLAARRFSGKIETTEAKELWAESRSIRKWSQERIEELNGVVGRLEARNSELEDRVEYLELENAALHREIAGKVDA